MDHQEIGGFVILPNPENVTSTDIAVNHREAVADEDVLADFVIALLRTDSPETQLRQDAYQDLEDFLKESKAWHLLMAVTARTRLGS